MKPKRAGEGRANFLPIFPQTFEIKNRDDRKSKEVI